MRSLCLVPITRLIFVSASSSAGFGLDQEGFDPDQESFDQNQDVVVGLRLL